MRFEFFASEWISAFTLFIPTRYTCLKRERKRRDRSILHAVVSAICIVYSCTTRNRKKRANVWFIAIAAQARLLCVCVCYRVLLYKTSTTIVCASYCVVNRAFGWHCNSTSFVILEKENSFHTYVYSNRQISCHVTGTIFFFFFCFQMAKILRSPLKNFKQARDLENCVSTIVFFFFFTHIVILIL